MRQKLHTALSDALPPIILVRLVPCFLAKANSWALFANIRYLQVGKYYRGTLPGVTSLLHRVSNFNIWLAALFMHPYFPLCG